MNVNYSLRLFLAGSASVITTSTLPQTVRAATYYWDVNGTTAGFSTVVGAWDGTSQFWNTDATGGGGGTLSATPTSADDLTIPQASTKTGSITVTGTQYASSLTFAANVGPTTTITGGTIELGGTGAMSGVLEASSGANAVASALTLNSEVSNFSISNTAAGVLTLSGNITGAAIEGTQTLNIGSTLSGGIALSKVIADGFGGGKVALAINNTSTGATTLSAANTFTGGLTLKAGTVSGTTSANAFGTSAGVVTLGAGSGNANATLSGGLAGTFPNPITVASGNTGVASITSSAAAVFSGAVTLNSHDLSLSPAGSALTLSGGVTGTGNLILKATGAGVITLATGNLDHLGTITNSGTGAAANVISATIGANVTGVVQNSATSRLTLSGANTYDGPTTLSVGTLSVGEVANLGAAASNLVFDGGTLQITGTTLTSLSGIGHAVVINPGKLIALDIANSANSFTVDLPLTQSGSSFAKLNAGTVVLNQTNSYSGMTTLSAGTLKLQNSGTGLTQTLGALTLAGIDVTLQSDNAGSGILSTTFGALTARVSGNTANIVVSGGTVGTDNLIKLAGAAGFIDKGVFFNGADYAARNTTDGYVRALAYGTDPGTSAANAIGAGSHVKLTASPAARVGDTLLSLNLAGSGVNYPMNSGTLTVPAIIKSGGGVSTLSGGTAVTAGTGVELVVRTNTTPDQLAISTPVTGTGTLTKSGSGTLTLSGVNTYSGATMVSAGTFEIGGTGQLNSGTYAGAISVATGATIKSNSSATQTLSGVISGGGGLTKDNTGTLTVSAANTFTGGVTLTAGTLKANGNANALGTAAATLVINGGTLDFNHSAALNFGRNTTVGGGATIISEKNAAGAGATYTLGTLSIGANTLNIQGGNVTSGTAIVAFGATTLTGDATFNVTKPAGGGNTQLTIGATDNGGKLLTLDGSGTVSMNNIVVSGAGGLTKNGAGTLILGAGGTVAFHTYTGPTTINGGVVMLFGNKAAGKFMLSNGMLTDYYRSTTAFTGGLGTGDNQIQVYGDSGFGGGNGNSTWRIGASGSVLQWGSTHFNPTSLKFLTPNDNMGPSIYGQVTLDNGLDLNGGARTIYVLPATGTNTSSSWGKISGIIKDDTGGGSLIKTGGGQLILSAANTFNGVTKISDGWLTLENALALQNGTLDTTNCITGTATAGLKTNQIALTLGGFTGNKDLAAVFTTAVSSGYASLAALTLNPGAGVTNSYSGTIANGAAGMTLTKTGLGTQILAGANTYTGTTTVNAGTLTLDYSSQDNSKLADAAALVLSGGTVNLSGGTHTEVVGSTTLGAATLSAVTRSSGAAVLALNAITPGYGRLQLGTGGIATTDNLNTNGILGIWATVGGSAWAVNSTNAADGLITAYDAFSDIAAQGSILADGVATNVRINSGGTSGPIVLGAAIASINTLLQNTTTAATIDTADRTLRINGVLLGSGMDALTIGAAAGDGTLSAAAEGGELVLINDNAARNLTINAAIADNVLPSALTKLGIGPVVLNAASTYSGATTIVAGTLQIGSGGSTGSISATSEIINNGALIYHRGGTLGVSHVISGTGSLTKQGAGTLTLSNANTYTGPTTVSAGTLQIGDGGISGSIAEGSSVTNNATLAYNRSDDVSVGNPINGSGSLTKLGDGKLTLTAVPRYSGHTTVHAGTLRLNSPNPNNDTSTVTLAASGALLELPFGGTETVGSFIIGTTQQAIGVYGHTDSGATNGGLGVGAMDAYFAAGMGALAVTPVTGFGAWQTANATSQTIGEDHDHDGVSNGVEYFLGGPTGNTTGFTALPGVVKTGNTIRITWTHAADYTGIYGTDFVVETSATLLANSWEAETLGGTVTHDGNQVILTFPTPLGTRKFARLKVNGP